MALSDPFRSPRQRLERAYNRIARFEDRIKGFLKTEPYSVWKEVDPRTGHENHSVRFHSYTPAICEDLASEALMALRSCLDQTGYAAAVAGGNLNPEKAVFCINHRSATDLDNRMKGFSCDLPGEIFALFRSFNAYPGGNDALCVLDKLRNAVHTVFVPNAFFAGRRRLEIAEGQIWTEAPDPPVWDSAKNEIVFLRTPPGANPKYNAEITLSVAFGEVDLVAKKPAVDVLYAVASEVKRVLVATEAECRRLGFIS